MRVVHFYTHKISFSDYFDLDELKTKHFPTSGVDIITMQEFLEKEALTGRLRDVVTNLTSFPPGN